MLGQAGLFDVDERLKRLSDLGDQLLAFTAAVDFEVFRSELTRALAYSDGSQGGRPPFDPVMMFKILVIQAANTLSDERTEFLINDRLSFMRFLGLGLSDRVPDARTIWLFREKLTWAEAIMPLFDRFDAALREAGYVAMGGQIVDASLIAAPKAGLRCHLTVNATFLLFRAFLSGAPATFPHTTPRFRGELAEGGSAGRALSSRICRSRERNSLTRRTVCCPSAPRSSSHSRPRYRPVGTPHASVPQPLAALARPVAPPVRRATPSSPRWRRCAPGCASRLPQLGVEAVRREPLRM